MHIAMNMMSTVSLHGRVAICIPLDGGCHLPYLRSQVSLGGSLEMSVGTLSCTYCPRLTIEHLEQQLPLVVVGTRMCCPL